MEEEEEQKQEQRRRKKKKTRKIKTKKIDKPLPSLTKSDGIN